MTAGLLRRRLTVGATSTALVAGVVGLVPLLANPAHAGCTPTYVDDAGDSAYVASVGTPDGNALLNPDEDLDILDVTHTVDGGSFTSVLHVAALGESGPYFTFADRFTFAFTVAGKAAAIEVTRDYTPGWGLGETGVLSVDGTASEVAVKVTPDYTKSTLSATITTADMDKAFGAPLAGKPFSAMSATAETIAVAELPPGYVVDEAVAPSTATYVFGASCSGGGGGTGGTGGTATPTATASATATATPTASATPTATASPTASPSAGPVTGPDGLFTVPRKNCFEFKDPTGDADPTGTGLDNEPALDVTGFVYKSPAGQLQQFVALADPSAAVDPTGFGVPMFDGPIWTTAMTVNAKVVALTASADGPATATVGGAANNDVKATAKVDAANKYVVFTVPLDGLSKAVGTTVTAGTAITATNVLTQGDSMLGAQDADTAAGTTPEEKTYTYGDNTCFMPPPGVLELEADTKAQYSDVAEAFATLTDVDGSPVTGAKVSAVLTGGRPVTAVTDSDGIAELRLPVLVPAGAKTLTVSFAGTSEVGRTSKTAPFTALVEKTVLKAVASRGGVTATLKDDDRKPVAGRTVHFLVGKTKKAVKTGSNGIAVLKGLKKGTVVKVSFPGVPGLYTATPTVTVKAG